MSLEFGMWDHFERRSGVAADEQYRERIALVRRAEELGLSGYHVAEHHLSPLSMAPSPLMFLATLAGVTSTIRLGSMVTIVPLYPAVRLAEEICMVDGLSGGRLEIGVGRGIRDVEHEWFGADPAATRDAFATSLERIRTALVSGKIEVPPGDGASATFLHEPTQRPLPPFWYVGNMAYAAEQGMSVLAIRPSAADADAYFAAFESHRAAGSAFHQGRPPRLGSTRPIYVTPDGDAARARARQAWSVLGDHFWATDTRVAGKAYSRSGSAGPAAPLEDAMAAGQVLAGTPDEVGGRLAEVLVHAGPRYGYLVNGFQWGDLDHDEARASLELFMAEVAPRLAEVHAGL